MSKTNISIADFILMKLIMLGILVFCVNNLFAAEGGPCKDYGDCDKFKYSLKFL